MGSPASRLHRFVVQSMVHLQCSQASAESGSSCARSTWWQPPRRKITSVKTRRKAVQPALRTSTQPARFHRTKRHNGSASVAKPIHMRLGDTLCPCMVVRAARGLQGSQSGALARYKDCMKGAGCLSRLCGDDHRRMCRAGLASPTTALTGDPQRHVGRPNRPANCEARRVKAKRLMPS